MQFDTDGLPLLRGRVAQACDTCKQRKGNYLDHIRYPKVILESKEHLKKSNSEINPLSGPTS